MAFEDQGGSAASTDVETTGPAGVGPADTGGSPAQEQHSETSIDDTLAAVWAKHNPSRGDGGKFKASGSPDTVEGDAQQSEATTDGTASPAQAGGAPSAPVSWPKDKAELWASLDPSVRDFILGREGEVEKGLSKSAERLKPYEELDKVLEPWADRWKADGSSPAKVVQQLLAAQAIMEKDPVAGINWLARSYGVNLGNQPQAQPGQGATADPVQHVQQELQGIKQTLAAQAEREQREFQSSLQTEIETFAKDVANSHYASVKTQMAALLQSGVAKDLKDAYDQAVWLVPEVREKVQAEQTKAAAAKAAAEAEKARAAKSLRVVPTSGKAAPNTIDDSLRDIAAKHYG